MFCESTFQTRIHDYNAEDKMAEWTNKAPQSR